MTRDQFIAAIKVVQDHEKECREAGKALGTLAKDSHTPVITLGSGLLEGYLNLLEEAMGDTNGEGSWIRWWLFEAPQPNPTAYQLGKKYTINTPGQLYDMIRRWQKHNKA